MSPTRPQLLAATVAAGSLLLAAAACQSDNDTRSGSDPSASHTPSAAATPSSPITHANPDNAKTDNAKTGSTTPAPAHSGTPTVQTASPTPHGTGTPTPSPTTTGPTADQPRGLKPSLPHHQLRRDKATDTALAFVITAETWDTRIDKRPNDAGRRAADLATNDLRYQMTKGEPKAAPGAEWEKLVNHHGYTTVKTTPGGFGKPPPDTKTKAIRGVTVNKQTMHGDHHWTAKGDGSGSGYVFTLHRDHKGAPWSVSDYNIE